MIIQSSLPERPEVRLRKAVVDLVLDIGLILSRRKRKEYSLRVCGIKIGKDGAVYTVKQLDDILLLDVKLDRTDFIVNVFKRGEWENTFRMYVNGETNVKKATKGINDSTKG